ncbi:hypothetical protein IMY05_C4778000200 [Salix suchowensis]|nr:hypothetical protein IMY05_C4778000200 [Salix suchowensis]
MPKEAGSSKHRDYFLILAGEYVSRGGGGTERTVTTVCGVLEAAKPRTILFDNDRKSSEGESIVADRARFGGKGASERTQIRFCGSTSRCGRHGYGTDRGIPRLRTIREGKRETHYMARKRSIGNRVKVEILAYEQFIVCEYSVTDALRSKPYAQRHREPTVRAAQLAITRALLFYDECPPEWLRWIVEGGLPSKACRSAVASASDIVPTTKSIAHANIRYTVHQRTCDSLQHRNRDKRHPQREDSCLQLRSLVRVRKAA